MQAAQIAIRQIKMTPTFSGANTSNFLLANISTYTVYALAQEQVCISGKARVPLVYVLL